MNLQPALLFYVYESGLLTNKIDIMKKKLLVAILMMVAIAPNKVFAQTFVGGTPSGDSLYYTINSDGISVSVTRWKTFPGLSLIIPSYVSYNGVGYTVTAIGDSAFHGSYFYVTSLTLPNTLLSIGNCAFDGLYNLENIVWGNSIMSIGSHAFGGCQRLNITVIPNSVVSIGDAAFSSCDSLKNITIPNADIGAYCFQACGNLESVVIGDGVTTIGDDAFRFCHSLSSLTIGNNVTTIGDAAFEQCFSLSSINWGNSITTIGNLAFSHDTLLTSVNLPNTLTSIGNGAFEGCIKLASINIPNSVTQIGKFAFEMCFGLQTVTIGYSVEYIGEWAFAWCPNITTINFYADSCIYASNSFAASVGTISDPFFDGQIVISHNESININLWNNVKAIPDSIFMSRHIDSISFPESVQLIGNLAFAGCGLSTIRFLSLQAPNIGAAAFSGMSSEAIDIFVPCIFPYQTAYNWPSHAALHQTMDECNSFPLPLIIDDLVSWNDSIEPYDYAYLELSLHNVSNPTVTWVIEDVWNSEQGYFSEFGTYYAYAAWSQPGIYAVTVTVDCDYGTESRTIYITVVEPCQVNEYPNTTDFENSTGCWHLWNGAVMENGNVRLENAWLSLIQSPLLVHGEGECQISFRAKSSSSNIDQHLEVIMYHAGIICDTTFSCVVNSTEWMTFTYSIPDSSNRILIGHDGTVESNEYVLIDDIVINFIGDSISQDTGYVPLQDTVFIYDTIYIDVPYAVHDTTFIDVPYIVHDTTTIHDTTYVEMPYAVHDTTYVMVTDTITNTVYDTITSTRFDTLVVDNYIYDTTIVYIPDTLWLTQYDTVWLHDTIYIHDTIVVGVDEVDAINAKIYTSNGQIVVNGAEGNTVWLYDVNGRMLATKQDEYSPLHFDVPTSGTYMIKIGSHPARKVVVVR